MSSKYRKILMVSSGFTTVIDYANNNFPCLLKQRINKPAVWQYHC